MSAFLLIFLFLMPLTVQTDVLDSTWISPPPVRARIGCPVYRSITGVYLEGYPDRQPLAPFRVPTHSVTLENGYHVMDLDITVPGWYNLRCIYPYFGIDYPGEQERFYLPEPRYGTPVMMLLLWRLYVHERKKPRKRGS